MEELKQREDGFDQLKKQLVDSYAAKKYNFADISRPPIKSTTRKRKCMKLWK